ncbi:MAG TPA: aromatic ring-hydroxylating dioxygenase subunit alpha [Burkholderiaceae bacterium]|nr:aromatic ring-hydroxylating dioxygenase subunit alpha [Burkholderiaceae bacterium]
MPHPGHVPPALPPTHYLDNRIFTDAALFEREQRRIFSKTWQFVCHDSEVASPGDFRCTSVAGKPIVVVRDDAGTVRTFFNVCRHRAAEVVRTESGNARSFTCFYHHWNYALDGRLRSVAKPEGYEPVRLDKSSLGLVPMRTECVLGLVFVCLDADAPPLSEFFGEALAPLRAPLGTVPMEVFHFHKAVIRTNWKLWQDNNSERYHSMLHAINRSTQPWVLGKTSPMKLRLFPNGHSGYWSDGEATVAYDRGGYDVTGGTLPGMRDNEMRVLNLFPDLMVNIRSNVVRIDRMIPLDAQSTMIEWRGLGVVGDDPQTRELRLRHHNLFWGPAGRNLPEDVLAVESQYRSMRTDVVRYSILAREEDLNPTDDANLRAFYQEWGRLMERSASSPFERSVEGVRDEA